LRAGETRPTSLETDGTVRRRRRVLRLAVGTDRRRVGGTARIVVCVARRAVPPRAARARGRARSARGRSARRARGGAHTAALAALAGELVLVVAEKRVARGGRDSG